MVSPLLNASIITQLSMIIRVRLDPVLKWQNLWYIQDEVFFHKSQSSTSCLRFQFRCDSVECVGYRIENALVSDGRRTYIFVNNVDPTLLNGVAITVIKDQ